LKSPRWTSQNRNIGSGRNISWFSHVFNGNSRILNWRYVSTIFQAKFRILNGHFPCFPTEVFPAHLTSASGQTYLFPAREAVGTAREVEVGTLETRGGRIEGALTVPWPHWLLGSAFFPEHVDFRFRIFLKLWSLGILRWYRKTTKYENG
jgi:hypothetical protein